MPGPLKNNPANTTGLLLTKAGGKRSRPSLPQISVSTLRTDNPVLDQFIQDLRKHIERLELKLEQHEQKLNRMQVDPTTKVVTFIA